MSMYDRKEKGISSMCYSLFVYWCDKRKRIGIRVVCSFGMFFFFV